MTSPQLVVFLDSGIGGIPYLQHFHQHYPDTALVYLADTKNFPYGGRSERELRQILEEVFETYILPRRPDLAVLACNTASVVGLQHLRQKFPQQAFVGTVPAIKPAAAASKTRAIGILATERTIRDPYLEQLHKRHAADCALVRIAANPLVELVEFGGLEDSERLAEILAPAKEAFSRARVDQLVLGCTHYIFAARHLQDFFGPDIELVDSREGVSRRIAHLLGYEWVPGGGRSGEENHQKKAIPLVLTGEDRAGLYKVYRDSGLFTLEEALRA